MRRLYALLTGINDYPTLAPLYGCVADIQEYQQFLTHRINHKTHELDLLTLLDKEATRAAVIDGFRRHLSKAGPEDTALFVFCGHGSQQSSAKENYTIEPDRLDETIVCYDSRLEGGSDLADKTMAGLIAEVAARGAHVTVILDSCHAASGTREIAISGGRLAPLRLDVGPAGYAPGNGSRKTGSGWSLPSTGRHILLAACGDAEIAKECWHGEQRRGAFSRALLDTLENSPGSLAYASLFQSAQAWVQARVLRQNPQLEATDPADLGLPFLGGGIAARPRQLSVDHDSAHGWMVNLGAVHGMPDRPDQPVGLLLFPRGASVEQMSSIENAVGRAVVSRVLPASSVVQMDFTPTAIRSGFEALIERLPEPVVTVRTDGDPEGVAQIRRALDTIGPGGRPSPLITRVENNAFLQLCATDQHYEIYQEGNPFPLTRVTRSWLAAASIAVERLEHIAAWQQVKNGAVNRDSSILLDEFELELFEDDRLVDGSTHRFLYREKGDGWTEPGFKIRVRNRSRKTRYFGLLAITESYEISPLLEEPSVRLGPRQTLHVRGGATIYSSLPEELIRRGGTETVDILRIMISTSPFDARSLRLPELSTSPSRSGEQFLKSIPAILRRFQNRTSRSLSFESRAASAEDWFTMDVPIVTVRPHRWQAVRAGETLLPLDLRLTCPAGFSARARMNSEGRDRDACGTPPVAGLFGGQCESSPFRFLEPSGADPGLAVLELDSLLGSELVTRRDPICLSLNFHPRPGERILPFAFDGRNYIPLGRSEMRDQRTYILIERLPETEHGKLCILFELLRSARTPQDCEPWLAPLRRGESGM